MRVLLAGGGSAGHVEPALCVAEVLRERGHEAFLLGTATGVESTLVPARGFPLLTIGKAAFPRRLDAEALRFLPRLIRAVRDARRALITHEIDVVVGFGGYVAWPAYAAARGLRPRIPMVVFSYDAKPGLANRAAARWTPWRAVGVRGANGAFADAEYTGVPLRRAIVDLDRAGERPQAAQRLGLDPLQQTLVVFGGSLGAARLNAALVGCADRILGAGWQVLHITGSRNTEDLFASAAVAERGRWRALPYLREMQDAYAVADLVLARAGAGTCAELLATGLPAVLVPYAVGNGEQQHNAEALAAGGGCAVLADQGLTSESLWLALQPLLAGADLRGLAGRAAAWSQQNRTAGAAQALADLVERAGRR